MRINITLFEWKYVKIAIILKVIGYYDTNDNILINY